jgi:hypothetical protein
MGGWGDLVEATDQRDTNEDETSKDISERVHTEVCNLQSGGRNRYSLLGPMYPKMQILVPSSGRIRSTRSLGLPGGYLEYNTI